MGSLNSIFMTIFQFIQSFKLNIEQFELFIHTYKHIGFKKCVP